MIVNLHGLKVLNNKNQPTATAPADFAVIVIVKIIYTAFLVWLFSLFYALMESLWE